MNEEDFNEEIAALLPRELDTYSVRIDLYDLPIFDCWILI